MEVLFVAGIAVIAKDPAESRELFVHALGLPLQSSEGSEYYHSDEVAGTKHFGVWPLSEAAKACFGTPEWPDERTVPQTTIEFELADAAAVEAGAQELVAKGYELLHPTREEPWGQTVARVQSPEGVLVGLSFAPWMH
jgi:catechol 2,3-dioxygenase-like lactoylglutathione lyase family enzyme